MPDLIRHPDAVPTKVGSHVNDWIPAFAGMTFVIEYGNYTKWVGGIGWAGDKTGKRRRLFLKQVFEDISKASLIPKGDGALSPALRCWMEVRKLCKTGTEFLSRKCPETFPLESLERMGKILDK